jgi:hypothetical protein
MAGDWIKMQVSLPDKPEVWQIAGALSIDADSVVGKLLRVWGWFDSHTEDGNAHGVSFPLIDRVAGVAGFAEAMFLAGWLEQNGTVLTLPKFARHNGKTGKNRALTNERVANHRKNKDLAQSGVCNAASVTKTVTREEKRREEKKEDTHTPTPVQQPAPEPTAAGRVCLAMRRAGIPDGNPGHPELLALIAAGASDAEFVGAAAAAAAKRKGFAYAIGTLKRQREEASAMTLHQGPMAAQAVTVRSDAAERTAALIAAQQAHTPEPPDPERLERLKAARNSAALRLCVPQIVGAAT